LAGEGASVVIADIQEEQAAQTAREIVDEGGRAIATYLDQSQPESCELMARTAKREFGDVEVLVNNAALFSGLERKNALEISPEEWEKVIQVDLTGPFYCCLAVMPGMVERGYGKIINISSGATFTARNQLAHYVAAKMGIVGLTRALAREYGNSGVRVNALSPGATASGAEASTPEYLKSRIGTRAIQRIQTPDDLLGAVIFLSSPMSDFITGQNLVVDGGGVFQ
jgi:3-oxoacyl-[acyl-carrier protein] reductase